MIIFIEIGRRKEWKNYFNSNKTLRESVDVDIKEDFIVWRQGLSNYHMKWSDIVKAKSNNKVILIFNSNISMFIIPVRAFFNDLEKNNFLDKLTRMKLLRTK
jgi:hypothetical protein